jgi:proline iminopeptidase
MKRTSFLIGVALAGVARALPASAATPTWFPTRDGRLAYERYGKAERRIVLLTGGPGIDPAIAAPLVADLAAENEVIVLHQRGTGDSAGAPASADDLTIAGAVDDLEALRRALGRETLHLAGQSWGSMLAMAYAAAHRSNVASLALLNPGGPDLHFMRGFAERVMAKLTTAERAAYEKTGLATPEQLRLELLGDVHDRAAVQPYLASLGPSSSNPRVFRSLMHDARRHYDVRSALSGFSAPTLLLFGDDDPSLAAKDDLVALFPQAQVVTLADAGHLGWLDQPAAYRAAVLDFTNSLPPA